ncbi:MAG: retron system putative HNH endonuclease [Agathobacter sp.]|nr:retron system putative HNH endonuclease [Agathobacter sp.]
MIYIQKRRTPRNIKEKAEQIKRDKTNGYEDIKLPEDKKRLRYLFDMMPKDEIRESLYKEQHGLCAYCMRRITGDRKDTKIEHYNALVSDKDGALDFQNYFGVCYGGEKDESDELNPMESCLCCDASKSDKSITINPWNKRHMDAIGYYKHTGEIYVRDDCGLDSELVDKMQKDIDDVLHLNGEKDSSGKIMYDTRSKLVASRRRVCDSVRTQFKRWGNDEKVLTADFLMDKISKLEHMLQDDNVADEFIGVRLYMYRRKAEKLRRMEARKKMN